ncbi:MAG: insulinase family protein [Proteobacteria bacterium]|nr:insulinase family protein [Pseudomonadota bacterium]
MTADWLLWIDPDEELAAYAPGGIDRLDEPFAAVWLADRKDYTPRPATRLQRRRAGVRWAGAVNEALVAKEGGPLVILDELQLKGFGHEDPERARRRLERNQRIVGLQRAAGADDFGLALEEARYAEAAEPAATALMAWLRAFKHPQARPRWQLQAGVDGDRVDRGSLDLNPRTRLFLHGRVVDAVGALCNDWRSSKSAADWMPVTRVQASPQICVEYRKTEQTKLAIAVPGLPMDHADRYALGLLSVILGWGMSSRLFVRVREREGLAYDVKSGVDLFLDCGALVVTASVDPKRLYDAVETILDEIGALRSGVAEDELSKAKQLSTGRMLMSLEDTSAVSAWMGNQELLAGRVLGPDDVIACIDAVTTEDVRRVANEILVSDRLNMAVAGPSRGYRRLERLLKL